MVIHSNVTRHAGSGKSSSLTKGWLGGRLTTGLLTLAAFCFPACSFDAHHAGVTPNPVPGDGGIGNVDLPPIRTQDAFINADVPGGGGDAMTECTQVLKAVTRDFRGWVGPNGEPKHPDFENGNAQQKGIAAEMLGTDSKPVYGLPGPTVVTTGDAEYRQWYRDVADVNMRFDVDIPLTADPARPGTFVFDSDVFFPLDGKGFGNQGHEHNFHFTTEVHFDFPYRGGEVFTFRGDDDLWLFVNGHLAIDLGGVHGALTGSVNLDQDAAKLNITKGGTYRMDIFHAERHTSRSTYHVETTLQCFKNIDIP